MTTATLQSLERRLCDAIAARGETMLTQLAGHVAIPTGMDHGPGLDQYRALLVERLIALGATIHEEPGDPQPNWLGPPAATGKGELTGVIAPIVVARHVAARSTPRVLMAGHMDTVHDPNGTFRELTIAPDGRHATGPGVVDMKGGILVAVTALEALAEAGVALNWTLVLNNDEETGSFQSERVLRSEAKRHDLGLAFEPALPGGALAIERMGSGQFKIEVFGRAAHVGREFTRGVSAVYALSEIINKLAAMSKPDQGMIVNVGPVQGGVATNIVPEYAACWGNVRFADPVCARTLAQAIDALASPPGSDLVVPRVILHRHWNRPAKPKTPQVERFAHSVQALAAELGQSMPFASTGGVCDGNILQDVGLPTLDTLGVRGGNLHRTDEFIELPSLVERCQLLALLLLRISDGRITV
jgi:glutamate carboxypeptidase